MRCCASSFKPFLYKLLGIIHQKDNFQVCIYCLFDRITQNVTKGGVNFMKDQILRIHNFGSFLLVNNLLVGLDVFKKTFTKWKPRIIICILPLYMPYKNETLLIFINIRLSNYTKIGGGGSRNRFLLRLEHSSIKI